MVDSFKNGIYFKNNPANSPNIIAMAALINKLAICNPPNPKGSLDSSGVLAFLPAQKIALNIPLKMAEIK